MKADLPLLPSGCLWPAASAWSRVCGTRPSPSGRSVLSTRDHIADNPKPNTRCSL